VRLLMVLGLWLMSSAACAGGAVLQAINVVSTGAGPRLELRLSAPAKVRLSALDHPYRLVIDLARTRQPGTLPVERAGAAAVHAVRAVRSGVRNGRDLRVVVELTRAPRVVRGSLLPFGGQYLYAVPLGHRAARAPHQAAPSPPLRAPAAVGARPARRGIMIALDPGHGGKDPGAHGPNGTFEKTVTLQIAKRLARLIAARPGMRAFLTRSGDYYVSLPKRRLLAYKHHADLFVSIHADSYPWNRHASGASVYMLSEHGATSVHARLLAESENRKAAMMGSIDLSDKDRTLASVLVDLAQTSALEASYDVAGRVLHQLDAIGDLHDRSVQRANFAVLRSAAMPSILVETAYISSYRGESRLTDPRYQDRIAQALLRGIEGYFRAYRPPATVVAGS